MILYHGTNGSFSQIDLAKGLPGKDFGRGFYTSNSLECARKTALQRVDRLGGEAVVLHLDYRDAFPSDLHIKRFHVPSREWALFVRANRRDYVEAEDHNRDCRYDVVIGPIANDKLSLQFRLFDKGLITLDAFTAIQGSLFPVFLSHATRHQPLAISWDGKCQPKLDN